MNHEKSKSHGGIRPGAGRKKEFGETTRVMRVPESMVDEVRCFIESRTEAKGDIQDKIYELEEQLTAIQTERDNLAEWKERAIPDIEKHKELRDKKDQSLSILNESLKIPANKAGGMKIKIREVIALLSE